jgi:hypothetical protein
MTLGRYVSRLYLIGFSKIFCCYLHGNKIQIGEVNAAITASEDMFELYSGIVLYRRKFHLDWMEAGCLSRTFEAHIICIQRNCEFRFSFKGSMY